MRKERNRTSARKARIKKNEYIHDLERRVHDAEETAQLDIRVRDAITTRNEILEHILCTIVDRVHVYTDTRVVTLEINTDAVRHLIETTKMFVSPGDIPDVSDNIVSPISSESYDTTTHEATFELDPRELTMHALAHVHDVGRFWHAN